MTSILGKYTSYNTILHRIDPRIKFFGLIFIMVLVFLPYGNYTNRFIYLGILTIFIIFLMIIGKVSFASFFKSLKMMWMMFVFLLIFMFFIPSEGEHLIVNINGYKLYYDGLLQVGHVSLRLILMIMLTVVLTSTTAPMDLTYALEWYLSPLKLVKFPIQVISLTISLALRFIPTLLNESQRIMNAQKSRGVDYNKGFLMSKVKSITTLIVPLLISCFSRSDELAIAMDARGYDPYQKRTKYKILKFSLKDLFSLIFIMILGTAFITLSVLSSQNEGFQDIINLIFGVKTW